MIRYLNERWYSFLDMRYKLGAKLCYFIMIAQHLMKGLIFGGGSGGIVVIPILFLFRSYRDIKLDAIQIQIYKNIALTPWALKSLIGVLSDTVSIRGLHKMPYIFFSLLVSIISCYVLASYWPVAPIVAVCLLFCINLSCAVTDLLVEARYSEAIREYPDQGPNITSFVWTGISLGAMISTVPIGLLLEYGVSPHWLYYIPILPFLFVLYAVCNNWLCDKLHITGHPNNNDDEITNCCGSWFWFSVILDPIEAEDEHGVYNASGEPSETVGSSEEESDYERVTPKTPLIGINWAKIKREKNAIFLSVCIAVLSITTSILGILQVHPYYLCGVSVAGNILMIIGFNLLVGGITAQMQTFVMVQNMFSMSISSAEFFFMTDTIEQFPEGPHFSKSFYVIAMGLTASVCTVLATASYSLFMDAWHYRKVFYFGNVISVLLGLLNVVFILRWNLLIGIPDWLFVIGSEVIQVIIGQWTNMPMTIAMGSLCPKNVEAIMYALLAGSSNLGNSLSQYMGASLLFYLGITPNGAVGESAKFEKLWIASLITTLLPLLTLVGIHFLIPDVSQKESLLSDNEKENPSYSIVTLDDAINNGGVEKLINNEEEEYSEEEFIDIDINEILKRKTQ